jgi:hypothetical protein
MQLILVLAVYRMFIHPSLQSECPQDYHNEYYASNLITLFTHLE